MFLNPTTPYVGKYEMMVWVASTNGKTNINSNGKVMSMVSECPRLK